MKSRKTIGISNSNGSDAVVPACRLPEINARIEELIRVSRERERVIDRLHQENQNLKAGELQRAMTPLLRGLMRLFDNLQDAVERQLAGRVAADPAGVLAGFRDAVEDLLYNQGVDRFEPAPGAPFNPREHRGIAPLPVDDPALERTIARCLRPGFRLDARILREADVEVYRLNKEPELKNPKEEENNG